MKTSIREAKIQDLPFIAELYNHNIKHTTSSFRYHPVTLAERKEWLVQKKEQGFPVLIAEKDKTLQGFASLAPFRQGEGYQYTAEHSIYVAVNHQRQGVAKILLTTLIQKSKQLNFHNIIAGIDDSNTASHLLHQSLGFQKCGTITQVGIKFEKWLDLTFYSLILGDTKK